MTNKKCLTQIKQMMGSWQRGGLSVLLKEAERLIESGGIDISDDDKDNFYSSKIILHIALENLSRQFAPISHTGEEIAENLKHF